ncbi:unnamed protein product [Bursaphelenchus okinawaensis]|uniref:Hydroxysteroid dehydrogenase-like protein 2 n=1 Tax=Bursaphelenchus okinawaensis TaxID=465554 RepID=A0A811KSL5_9BILA|nr:unnamed protein product [Bursaphelenchus okinawaensis]CAG9109788.1 unnamed protein product [Bursaphelenchus okinawaensis]
MVDNTGYFKGKTVFVSGGSRGIGLAIAKKLARDGANIVIAAKTTEPHPKLPGTIYTAAKEIEAVGGKCLPLVMDVRYEEEVEKAVKKAVDHFGGIDILLNNASAISTTPTEQTDMKRYDLMQQINTRGTFLLSKTCLPYLKKASNPHILNLSPSLLLDPQWFRYHVGYTISKYGMSMCVLGMAHEFKEFGIAVNGLWPRTAIWTAAITLTSNDEEARNFCRKDDIMADSAYLILSKNSRQFSGQFVIDDEILQEHGVTDMDRYTFVKDHPIGTDFFIPGVEYFGPFTHAKI